MIWQEWVFILGALLQLPSLLPTLLGPNKPPVSTSLPIALILFAFAATFVTLDQLLSAASMCATATIWALIALQRLSVRLVINRQCQGLLIGSRFLGLVKGNKPS